MPASSLIVVAAVLVGATPALAAKPRLAVVPIGSATHLSGIALKLTLDAAEAAKKDGAYDVTPPDAVEKALGADILKKLYACGERMDCAADLAVSLRADRLIVGLLDRTETSYLVKLFLVDVAGRKSVSSVDRSILIASRRLESDIVASLPGLLAGKAEAIAKVSITTTVPGASVVFDGAAMGKTPLAVETKPGKHVVKVTKEKYLPVERFVNAEAGVVQEIKIPLLLIPGEVADEAVAAAAAPAAAGGWSVPTATWIAGGIAVAAAGVGTVFGLQVSSLAKKAVDADLDGALDITRADALAGRQNALVANVAFGVAAVAAVGAVVMAFVLDGGDLKPSPDFETPPAPHAVLVPAPGGAALAVGGSF